MLNIFYIYFQWIIRFKLNLPKLSLLYKFDNCLNLIKSFFHINYDIPQDLISA